MGLLSLLKKQEAKQEPGREFHSRAEEDSASFRKEGGRRRANSASREAVDPVLPEKKRARRRLIGAIALVLAVVIVLPMVLDSEPKPLSSDVAIQIPPRDKPEAADSAASAATSAQAASSTASSAALNASASASSASAQTRASAAVHTPATPAPTPTATTAGKPARARISDSLDAGEEVVSDTPRARLTDRPAVDKPVRDKAPADKPADKGSEKTTERVADKPVRKPPEKSAEKVTEKNPEKTAEKAPEKVPEKPPKKPETEHKAEHKTADKVAEKPARRTEDPEDAARATAILEGRDGAEQTPKKPARQLLQVAALTSADKVEQLQQKLAAAGIHSSLQKSGETTRIRVGPFSSQEEADRMRARLRSLGLDAKRVDLPN